MPRTFGHLWRTALVVLLIAVAVTAVRAQSRPAPSRIVSASPSITETLFALGLGDRVVGVSTYCRFPQPVLALPRVGTYLKPNAEVISRLAPDLVLLHKGPNAAASQLATLGLKTTVVDSGTLPSVFTSIRTISLATEVPERGDALARDIRSGLDVVAGAVAGKPPRRVLIIVGRRTGTLSDITAVGPGSYLDDILTIAGGVNVLASASLQYPRISMETVISLAPDVLVDVGEMGESPEDSVRRQQITERLWRQQRLVKAVRDDAMHAINDEAFTVPGPRIVRVAQTLAGWFHGVEVR